MRSLLSGIHTVRAIKFWRHHYEAFMLQDPRNPAFRIPQRLRLSMLLLGNDGQAIDKAAGTEGRKKAFTIRSFQRVVELAKHSGMYRATPKSCYNKPARRV